jgi:hypothetical protein
MRSRACLWARCGQRGKGGREGGERGGSKEKAFALLSRCGGKKRGKSVDERRLLARAGPFPWPYFFLG